MFHNRPYANSVRCERCGAWLHLAGQPGDTTCILPAALRSPVDRCRLIEAGTPPPGWFMVRARAPDRPPPVNPAWDARTSSDR